MSRVGSWFPQGMWTVRPDDDETRRLRLQKEIQADPNLKRAQRRLDYKQEAQEGIQSGEISQYDIEQGAAVDLDAIRTISSEQEAAQLFKIKSNNIEDLGSPKSTRHLGFNPTNNTWTNNFGKTVSLDSPNNNSEDYGVIGNIARQLENSEKSLPNARQIDESLINRLKSKARGNTLTRTGSVGGKGSMANNAQRLLDIYKARLEQGAGVEQGLQSTGALTDATRELDIPGIQKYMNPGITEDNVTSSIKQLEELFDTGADKAADVAKKGKDLSLDPLGVTQFNTATGKVSLGNPATIALKLALAFGQYKQAEAAAESTPAQSTYRSGTGSKMKYNRNWFA